MLEPLILNLNKFCIVRNFRNYITANALDAFSFLRINKVGEFWKLLNYFTFCNVVVFVHDFMDNFLSRKCHVLSRNSLEKLFCGYIEFLHPKNFHRKNNFLKISGKPKKNFCPRFS